MNNNIFQEIEDNTQAFIDNLTDHKLLEKIIKKANDLYYNGTPALFDDTYDLLVDKLAEMHPKSKVLKEIGAPVKSNKAQLPYHMGSMNKLKPDDSKKFAKWRNNYPGPYILSYKLDGISALLCVSQNEQKLYTRGNGTIGQDISHLLQFININEITNYVQEENIDNMCLRGELIMKKATFYHKYPNNPNPRNFVSGIINSKTINHEVIPDIDLIFYEIIHPWHKIDTQFEIMTSMNINVAQHDLTDKKSLTINALSAILKDAKATSEYEIDGIIVSDTNKHNRNTSGNPSYSFAFKENTDDETKEAIVETISWNVSKDKILVPVVNITPIKLSGVTISNITGNNARFIVDNEIGPGAILKITRSGGVIPKIVSVIKKSSDNPLPSTSYEWNDTGANIIDTSDSNECFTKEITHFMTTLEIANVGIGVVKKLVENNIITKLEDIFYIKNKRNDILELEGFGPKKTDKILQSIESGIDEMKLTTLMNATNIFGRNIGERKIEKILETYPNILTANYVDVIDKIDEIEGFDKITATKFAEHINDFNDFLEKIPTKIKDKLLISQNNNNEMPLNGITFLFTGFRDKNLKKIIEDNGGKVNDSFSKNINYVITIQDNDGNKLEKAKKANIPIILKDDLPQLLAKLNVLLV